MKRPLVCLSLTGRTLAENAAILARYKKYIDIAELRADCLDADECLYLRRFPAMAGVPCVLTIRRLLDGGKFASGEISRIRLFGRALAFASDTSDKNFAYVDFEEDFNVPSLQDASLAFGIKIIRSFIDINNPVYNIKNKCDLMRKTGYEIPKIEFRPHTLSDVTNLFSQAERITEYEHILCAMGNLGLPSRILAEKLNSYLTYVSPEETAENTANFGYIDPVSLHDTYMFGRINKDTKIFGFVGWPLTRMRIPEIHNSGFESHRLNNVMLPVRTEKLEEAFVFAEKVGIKGFAVTVPFQEAVMPYLYAVDDSAALISSCNTIIKTGASWIGVNTSPAGFRSALEEFLGGQKLRRKKVAVIGAGGAAHAVAYALKQMGAKACIFNRTLSSAKNLAEKYGFKYAPLDPYSVDIFEAYAGIIIQTTSVGMNSEKSSDEESDPIYFYRFSGREKVFDLVYMPEITPLILRAKEAGCKVCNGMRMMEHLAHSQFKYFTGVDYRKPPEEKTGSEGIKK